MGPGAVPPLVDHGGPVMATPSAGNQVVVTPIFWEGSGYTFTSAYKNLITQYLADVAADSGRTTNVFATMFQYSGSNGAINYRMALGTPITDTTPYPAPGCTVNPGAVYVDSSSYSTCVDDLQVGAETPPSYQRSPSPATSATSTSMFLPKHVESVLRAGQPRNPGLHNQPDGESASVPTTA